MHTLVRRFLKTGIAFLGVGLALGAWMLIQREMHGVHPSPYLASAHTHAILVGFVMMMILGVALWLFPRPDKSDERYSPVLATVAYWMIAAGTGARVAGEVARDWSGSALLRIVVVSAGLAQVLGIGLFFFTMWSRIRPAGSKTREAQGERF